MAIAAVPPQASSIANTLEAELEKVLRPLPENNGAGCDLKKIDTKESTLFAEIEGSRRAAHKAVADEASKRRAAWDTVRSKATAALSTGGKDLPVALSLGLAWIYCHGWSALPFALRLVRELHERFWLDFYPSIEFEDYKRDLGIRVACLRGVEHEDAFPLIIRMLPVTQKAGIQAYSLSDLERFELLRRADPVKDAWTRSEGETGVAEFDKAALDTPEFFYISMRSEIEQSLEELEKLLQLVRQKYEPESDPELEDDFPAFGAVKCALEDVRDLINAILRKKGVPGLDTEGEPTVSGPHPVGGSSGVVELKEPACQLDAIALLEGVMRHFARMDRHNAAIFLIQEAIRWTRMPPGEWFLEIAADASATAFLSKLMRPTAEEP